MKDSLGDRMKEYEDISRISLLKKSYVVIRVDGKAFHTYTKGLKRPFDDGLIDDMDATAAYLCKNIMGAKFAYVQSDEISVLITDIGDIGTQAWFDNNIQKMVSVSASMATSKFNQLRLIREAKLSGDLVSNQISSFKFAEFDSRVWQLPSKMEVYNYFLWRQQDATRNSISSVAQSLYSPKELMGKDGNQKQELIFQKGINWNDYSSKYKRGRIVYKQTYVKEPDIDMLNSASCVRTKWSPADEIPVFSQDQEFLNKFIPDK